MFASATQGGHKNIALSVKRVRCTEPLC